MTGLDTIEKDLSTGRLVVAENVRGSWVRTTYSKKVDAELLRLAKLGMVAQEVTQKCGKPNKLLCKACMWCEFCKLRQGVDK